VTRVHLTVKKLKNRLLVALLQSIPLCYFDLDPRLPILLSSISSDITLPQVINWATYIVSNITLVTRTLGLPRSLALLHKN